MALEQNKQCFLHRWLCPRTPGVFSLAIQGVTFYPRSQQKRATPTWCYSPHSTTLRFGALSSVAHTLMRYLDLTCELVSVQALPKHLHHLLPAFRVARFTRSAPHRHLLFQVTQKLQKLQKLQELQIIIIQTEIDQDNSSITQGEGSADMLFPCYIPVAQHDLHVAQAWRFMISFEKQLPILLPNRILRRPSVSLSPIFRANIRKSRAEYICQAFSKASN